MTKSELKNRIKSILLKQYGKKSEGGDHISLDLDQQSIIDKFPEVKKIIIDLLTDQYELFIKEVQWVAPKPTTFKIVLMNDQHFFLLYTGRSWTAQIEGKKYYLSNLKERENSSNALSRVLKQGSQIPQEKPEEEAAPEDSEETE